MNNNIVTLRLVPVAGGVGQHNNNNGILAGQAVPNAAVNVNMVGQAGQPALPPALPAPFAPLAMQAAYPQQVPAGNGIVAPPMHQQHINNGILAGQAVPNAAGNDVNRVGPAGQPALLALPPALPAALAPALAPAAPFAPLAMQVSPRQPLPAHHASTHHPSTRCAECDLFMYSARYINQHVTHLCPALGRGRPMVIECTACGGCFNGYEALHNHLSGGVDDGTYCCPTEHAKFYVCRQPQCDFTASHNEDFANHIQDQHQHHQVNQA